MNRYVAFTFGTAEKAAEARLVVRALEDQGKLGLYDAVVLTRDGAGRQTRVREPSGVPFIGAMAGALVGLVLVFALPILGILVGAGAGALLAMLLFDRRIDQDYIADVERDLAPGTSALLVLISSGDVATLGCSLSSFHGWVSQSTLPAQLQATLRQALGY